jgi:hypothetical protein
VKELDSFAAPFCYSFKLPLLLFCLGLTAKADALIESTGPKEDWIDLSWSWFDTPLIVHAKYECNAARM